MTTSSPHVARRLNSASSAFLLAQDACQEGNPEQYDLGGSFRRDLHVTLDRRFAQWEHACLSTLEAAAGRRSLPEQSP
jgi:hypothetical protein